VDRDGAFTSRRGPGEGLLAGRARIGAARALKWVLKQASRDFQGASGSFEDWDDAEKPSACHKEQGILRT
jgi:hypothetical protein